MTTWDDRQYLRFADERTRPARELVARIPLGAPATIADLGCGPGNSTILLHKRWPKAKVWGVDNSPKMLQRAKKDYPQLGWMEADISRYAPQGKVDLLFANALFQWLPDHATLLPRLLGSVSPGGVMAFQVPCNFQEPSHRLMRSLEGPWSERTAKVRATNPVETPEFYYDLLAPHCQWVDVWQTTYQHVMKDPAAIVEWVQGTGLRPFLEVLSMEETLHFLEAYTQQIDGWYPPRADGKRLFAFPRLFVVAQLP